MLLVLTVIAPSLPAQTSAKSGEQLKAAFDAHKGDFDYLLGEWEFTSVSKAYGKGRGYWTAVRLETGAILDEFRVVGDDAETYYLTTTLRAYNAAQDRWELVGIDGAGGLQDIGYGNRRGDEVQIEQKFGVAAGNPSMLRIRYFDIKPDRFSWKADRSNDGGKTWSKDDQQIEARRIGPPRPFGALTSPKKLRK
jgi:hypothetical protein